MCAVETHCLCESFNMYVIIDKYAIVSALLFSQSEQKVKTGICTINHKTCTKGLRKKVCVFSIFVKTTQQNILWRKRFLWKLHKKNAALYILHYKHGRGCRLRFSGNLLYYDCTDEVRATKKRGTERQQNEPDAMRRAFMLAVLPTLAQRGNTGQRIHCKGGEQTEIRLQVLYCGRGHSRRASAIRAYKVKRTPPAQSGGTFQKVYDLLTIIIN